MDNENLLDDLDLFADGLESEDDLAEGVPTDDSFTRFGSDSDDDEIVMDSYDEEAEF